MSSIDIQSFFDEVTFTVTYIVSDKNTKHCAIIDSVLDFDITSGKITTASAEKVISYISKNKLKTQWIIETHIHADHLTAAVYLRENIGGKIVASEHVTSIQSFFKSMFNEGDALKTDGSQFCQLLSDGDELTLGDSRIHVMHTPGHTASCLSFVIDDAIFVGDTVFMPDYGTARTDFPGGDAEKLYDSIIKILAFPDHYRIFLCHDYKPPGRDFFAWECTVADQKAKNPYIKNGITRTEFIERRKAADSHLSVPKLILPAVQVNIRAGNMPKPEENGTVYLKLPINVL